MTISRSSALLAALLPAIVALMACSSQLPANVAENAAEPVSGLRDAVSDAENLALGFQAAYGHREAFRETPNGIAVVRAPEDLFYVGPHTVLISSVQPLTMRGKALEVSYLDRKDSKSPYTLRKTWETGVNFVFDWNVSSFFGPTTLFAAEASIGAGASCGTFSLIELREEGPVTVAAGPLSYYSNLNDKPVEVNGAIVAIEAGRSFSVRYSGTHNLTETWQRKGDHYVRTSDKRLPDYCDWSSAEVKR